MGLPRPDAQGNIFLSGGYAKSIDFGGGPLKSAGNSSDVFLAKVDTNGGYVWGKRFGDSSDQRVTSMTLDAEGQPVLVGTFGGTVDFGGGALISSGGQDGKDVFVAKFDTTGKHLWSRGFGGPSGQSADSLAVDATGAALLAGTFNGTLDFGGPALTNTIPGSADIFLAKLNTP